MKYSNSEQRAMDAAADREIVAHEKKRVVHRSCPHSLWECVGCQVARETCERREAAAKAECPNCRGAGYTVVDTDDGEYHGTVDCAVCL